MALEQEGFKIINNITWQKTNPPPNLACRCFTHSTETILWARKNDKKSRHFFNYQKMKEDEKIEVFPLMVVKKDQTREAYSREKLKTGIVMACHKRPIPTDAVNRLVDDIETTIFNNYEKEVSSKVIGELVMEKLKTLDEVAYVRFASVYRSFTDLNNFAQELENMIQREKKQ